MKDNNKFTNPDLPLITPKDRHLEAPLFKRREPTWKVKDNAKREQEDRFRIDYNSKGEIHLIEEVVQPVIDPSIPERRSTRSRFTLQVFEPCFVGGHPAPKGCKIICYSQTAGCLGGRAKILEEERNAF